MIKASLLDHLLRPESTPGSCVSSVLTTNCEVNSTEWKENVEVDIVSNQEDQLRDLQGRDPCHFIK
jgi:hypothetical protein